MLVQTAGDANSINISWTSTTIITGVEQNYTIVLDICSFEITKHFYTHQQNASDIKCSVYIIAENGAGKSDPSNNVNIPSLPDIGPVTASLTHQVWKYDGEIRVNVSFEVRSIIIIIQ